MSTASEQCLITAETVSKRGYVLEPMQSVPGTSSHSTLRIRENGIETCISNKDADANDTASDASTVRGIHIGAVQLDMLDASAARTGMSNSFRLRPRTTREHSDRAVRGG